MVQPSFPIPVPVDAGNYNYTQGGASHSLAASGGSSDSTTTNWRSHFQVAEIMYTRKTQYSPESGAAEFNYLDCAYTLNTEEEHWWGNASSGDFVQLQTFSVISDSASGGFGGSGMVITNNAGIYRREVRTGDEENRRTCTGNVISGKQPGPFVLDNGFDSSDTAKATLMDILMQGQSCAPNFEVWLLDI